MATLIALYYMLSKIHDVLLMPFHALSTCVQCDLVFRKVKRCTERERERKGKLTPISLTGEYEEQEYDDGRIPKKEEHTE